LVPATLRAKLIRLGVLHTWTITCLVGGMALGALLVKIG
jgi:hypothetical protein